MIVLLLPNLRVNLHEAGECNFSVKLKCNFTVLAGDCSFTILSG